MLNVTNGMKNIAKMLIEDRSTNHISDGVYDFFTRDHETVAVTYRASNTSSIENFDCGDFAIIDSYDFR